MNYEIITLREKIVAGIAERTNNKASDMKKVIGGLWEKFYKDGIYKMIPEKTNKSSLAIYTDSVSSTHLDVYKRQIYLQLQDHVLI